MKRKTTKSKGFEPRAVYASLTDCPTRERFTLRENGLWACDCCGAQYRWDDLTDIYETWVDDE